MKLWYRHLYAWHKVDEYLARCREDYQAASYSLNKALEAERKYRLTK